MKTEVAKVFNKKTGETVELTARAVENLFLGNKRLGIHPSQPVAKEDLEFSDSRSDLIFRRSYKSDGDKKFIRAHWARPKGYGDDHLYNRDPESVKEAIKSGKSILLTLNLSLCSSSVSFEKMRGHCARPLENWRKDNRGSYITASVNSVEDTLKTIKHIKSLADGGLMCNRIFVTHRDAVIPYRNFFVGSRNRIVSLYNDMKEGKGGVHSVNKTLIMGFPRLMSFIPTGTTVRQEDPYRLKGNHAKGAKGQGKPYLTQLIFENEDDKRNTPEFEILKGGIIGDSQAAYVLASPTVYLSKSQDDWKYLFLDIKNIPAQALTLDPEAKEKLLHYREREEKRWGIVQPKNEEDPPEKKEEIIFPGNRPNEHYL